NALVGVVVLIATFVVAATLDRWHLKVPIDPTRTLAVREALLLCGASLALGFPLGVSGAILSGLQRYDLANAIGVAVHLVRAVAFVIVLRLGGGLVELAWTSLAMNLAGHVLSWWMVRRLLPDLPLGRRFVDRDHLGLIGSYSGLAFVGAIANSITFQTDA